MFTLFWLAVGLVLGAVYANYARSIPSGAKRVFGSGLIIAALIYFAFIFRAPDPVFWAAVEGLGVILFGLMGITGIRGSGWWLVVGWAIHPAWGTSGCITLDQETFSCPRGTPLRASPLICSWPHTSPGECQ